MIFSAPADSKAIDNIQYILKTWKEWMKKQEHDWKVENNIPHSSTLFLKLRKKYIFITGKLLTQHIQIHY